MTVTARRFRPLLVAATMIATLAALGPVPAASGQQHRPAVLAAHAPARTQPARAADRIIVKYRESTSASTRGRSRVAAGVELSRKMRSIDAEVVRPKGRSMADALAALRSDPAVERANPDSYLQLDADPTDEPWYQYQWGLENTGDYVFSGVESVVDVDIDAAGAWPISTGTGVTVAVLDDGVDFDDPELAGQGWTNPGESGPDGNGGDKSTNEVDDDGDGAIDNLHGINLCGDADPDVLHVPFNPHGPGTDDDTGDFHGTAVAGVIAAAANGAEGVGIAPDADIMAVRWLEGGPWEDECAQTSLAIDAIHYAVDKGADVINASWGGAGDDPDLKDAIQYAANHHVLFVAAAGNEGTSVPHYPAAYDVPNLISVGAIQADGELTDFSNYGSWVDISAPGATIIAPVADAPQPGPNDYGLWSGTSFSAPYVAGVAALLAQAHPELLDSASALKSKILLSGWRDSKTSGLTSSARVLDAKYALDFAPPTPPAFISGAASSGQTLPTSTVLMRIAWPAASDANGIDAYRVRYRRTGTSTWSTIVASTTKTYVDKTLTVGIRYDIEVSARDRGGNSAVTTTTLKPSRYQESTSLATYHGTWKTSSSSSYSGGKTRYATAAGAYVSFGINAKSLALVMPKGPTRGYFRVYIDGSYVKSISLYSATTKTRLVVFARNWSSVGLHTIKVVVSGTNGHPRVDIDAVIAGQ
jgi:subtilisin family serine protease